MRVSVVRGGGFAGLVTTVTADTERLSAEDARTLRARVEDAGLFALSDHTGATPGAADELAYELSVDDGDRHHRVLLTEGAVTAAIRSLIAWVESVPGHEERVGPPDRGGTS